MAIMEKDTLTGIIVICFVKVHRHQCIELLCICSSVHNTYCYVAMFTFQWRSVLLIQTQEHSSWLSPSSGGNCWTWITECKYQIKWDPS